MRTNIVLDDDLLEEAWRYSQATSKTALVAEALRTFVALHESQERTARYRQRLAKVREAVGNLKFRASSADLVRRDRERA